MIRASNGLSHPGNASYKENSVCHRTSLARNDRGVFDFHLSRYNDASALDEVFCSAVDNSDFTAHFAGFRTHSSANILYVPEMIGVCKVQENNTSNFQ